MRGLYWFALVGALAALTHYGVAVSLESFGILTAAYANIVGFMLAFPVSYVGHYYFSFAHSAPKSHRKALPQFFLVALCGFVGNEALVIAGLRYTTWPFWLILAVVMVIVAVSTFLLSKYWAFKSPPP